MSNYTKFANIISPLSRSEFFKLYHKGSIIKIDAGNVKKFCHLFPWNHFNNIMQEHRISKPRLRIFDKGKLLDEAEYTSTRSYRRYNLNWPCGKKIKLLLKNGATLVLNSVEETYQPLYNLVRDFENIFNKPFQVNAYLSSGNKEESSSFGLHWDDHDIFILQVLGKKHWCIYEDFQYPIATSKLDINSIKNKKPIFNEVINQGDLLFMPRGFWHKVVSDKSSTSLHLSFGTESTTGLSFLQWIQKEFEKNVIFRKDFPLLNSKQSKDKYVNEVKTELEFFLQDSNKLIIEFQNYIKNCYEKRKVFKLKL
jgi:hypothetical protein